MIEIAAYNGSARYGSVTTGVGRHVKQMVAGLHANPAYRVRFFVPSDHWIEDCACGPDSPLHTVPSVRLPISRRALNVANLVATAFEIEKFSGPIDWVYCPRELYVRTRGAKVAVTVHDVYPLDGPRPPGTRWRRALSDQLWWRAIREADRVLAVSEFTKDRIVRHFEVEPDRIAVVGNGVEDRFFRLGDATRHDPAQPAHQGGHFLSIGGLSRKKGGEHLLRFCRVLERRDPTMRLFVVGPVDQEYSREVRATRNLQLIARGATDETLATLLVGAIGSITLSEYEGFGIPALEAMAAHVPAIVSRRAALPEVTGDAAIVVEPTSDRQLAYAIECCLDPLTRRDLIAKGDRRARQFTWSASLARLEAALD